jgi:photosystem II stability/assembly factor-like uncharacterized protein
MKTSYICKSLFLSLLILIPVFAQNWQTNLPAKNPDMLTLFDYQAAFNNYWAPYNVVNGYYIKDGVKTKASGWKQFKRWEYYWEQRINPSTGEFPNTNAYIEFKRSRSGLGNFSKYTSSAKWTSLGPSYSLGGYSGQGRLNCIAFHPSDLNTYWVGSPSGGIWQTTDNGSNWKNLNDNMPVLGVSDIVVNPDYASSKTMYIATGDRDGGSLWSLGGSQRGDNNSAGVFKTTNGGVTWDSTGLTFINSSENLIGRLLMDPDNSSILYASTTNGIYKTTDAGVTWAKIYTSSSFVNDMKFKPGDSQTIYACSFGLFPLIIKSTNGGASWLTLYTFNYQDYRCELAVTPANPNILYVLVSSLSSTLTGIFLSVNSGADLHMIYDGSIANHNLLGYNTDGSDMKSGQGRYDLCISVSPVDANLLFIGGINLWESTDGGLSWKAVSNWYNNTKYVVHCDQHALAFQTPNTLFAGNDGGLYRSALSGSILGQWEDKTKGIVITQIYRIGVAKQSNLVLAGNQDNGTKLFSSASGSWKDVMGGDGMVPLIDYSNPDIMYGSQQNGVIYRTTDAFSNSSWITNNIPGGQPTGSWVTPYIMDPLSPKTLYFGFDRIWKTNSSGDVGSWTDLSGVLHTGTQLYFIAMSPANTNIIYTGDHNRLWITTNANTLTPPAAWTNITGTLPVTYGGITYLTAKDSDPYTLWVTIGGYKSGQKVYQTTDGGTSWTNISGTLPNIPIMCIVQNKRVKDRDQLFIGTDVGVYVKDGNSEWSFFSDGLPNCVVTDLAFYYDIQSSSADKLIAGTFARGLWETPVPNGSVGVFDASTEAFDFSLSQNYPNPFNPGTIISYSLPAASNVKLIVYNTLGQAIKILESGYKPAGNYSVNFNASGLPSGIYFYKLEAGQYTQIKKMVLIK